MAYADMTSPESIMRSGYASVEEWDELVERHGEEGAGQMIAKQRTRLGISYF